MPRKKVYPMPCISIHLKEKNIRKRPTKSLGQKGNMENGRGRKAMTYKRSRVHAVSLLGPLESLLPIGHGENLWIDTGWSRQTSSELSSRNPCWVSPGTLQTLRLAASFHKVLWTQKKPPLTVRIKQAHRLNSSSRKRCPFLSYSVYYRV